MKSKGFWMQIDFEAKKLKEAREYVSLLQPTKLKLKVKPFKQHKESFFKKVLKVLFK